MRLNAVSLFFNAFSDTKDPLMQNREEALKVCDEPDRIDGKRSSVPQWVACRKCKKCLNTRHTDLAGRAMAESLVSEQTVALTLTYADWTGSRAQTLQYRDVQLMLKRLRRDGYQVRFLVAGEYGSKRQRPHWHCVLFFNGKAPPMPPVETKKQHWKYWADVSAGNSKSDNRPLGFVFVQKPDFHGLRYVVKYAVKDDQTGKTTRKVQMSLKPPLGAAYWDTLAQRDVKMGKSFDFAYTLPDCRFGNGEAVKFYTTGRSAELKWLAYRKAHLSLRPKQKIDVNSKAHGPLWALIVPAALRDYFRLTDRSRKLPKASGRYIKARQFGNIALVKMWSGDVIAVKYHGPGKELSSWRVEHVQEMIGVARGRVVGPARQLRYGQTPF